MGPCGVYGLDYPAVLAVGSLYLPGVNLGPILEDLQVMERHALTLAYQKAKQAQPQA
jgi:hypothetical protein